MLKTKQEVWGKKGNKLWKMVLSRDKLEEICPETKQEVVERRRTKYKL